MPRLVCYNIEYCEGVRGAWYEYLMFWRSLFAPRGLDERIADALSELHPDIVALVEVDTGSVRAGKDEAAFINHQLGMKSLVERVKYPLSGLFGLFHHFPVLRRQANALSANYELEDVKYHVLHEGAKRVVIEASVECPQRVTLLLAHLALGGKTRKRQLAELVGIVNDIDEPVVLMGDFNTFSGDAEIASLLAKTRLRDAARREGVLPEPTHPALNPSRRLDYVLVSDRVEVESYRVLEFDFSDHRPLLVDFSVE